MLSSVKRKRVTLGVKDLFRQISARVSASTGSAYAFLLAFAVVAVWAITGALFHFSNTWQLVINTGTTIVTFLMVFLIQNTQNRDGRAIQLKLDELIRSSTGARNAFVDIEELTDEDLDRLDQEFRTMHEKEAPSDVMHKLHKRIVAEHRRRQSLRGHAGEALNKFLHQHDDKQDQ